MVMSESRETAVLQKFQKWAKVDRRAKRAACGLEKHVEIDRRAKRAACGLENHIYCKNININREQNSYALLPTDLFRSEIPPGNAYLCLSLHILVTDRTANM